MNERMTVRHLRLVVDAAHYIVPSSTNLILMTFAPSVRIARIRRQLSQKPGAIRKRRLDARRRKGLDHYALLLPTARLKAAMQIRALLDGNKEPSNEDLKKCIASAVDFTHQEITETLEQIIGWWWQRWLWQSNALLKKLKP
jgi:hypothetical protein